MITDSHMAAWVQFRATLSPEELAAFATEKISLSAEIHHANEESPASARAQALGARWLALMTRIYGTGVPVSEHIRLLRGVEENAPGFGAWRGWKFLADVLEARRKASEPAE